VRSNAPGAWWKKTTIYQIYPRSYADSNGDGVGDIPGIIDKLDYLGWLGVETLWLSPFFASPQADFGYDITNHVAIDPLFGTIDDVRRLIREVHARGMRIVFDLVLNHTSNRHPWFVESRKSTENEKRSHYIWRPGRGRGGDKPPNNWRSMLGGSGWHRDEETGEWYWASFFPFQPDLNYRNPEVKRAMLAVVQYWLDEGVDGFRLDIFNALFKDRGFEDNPFSFRPIPSEENPHGFFQRYRHTIDHPDTFAFARELRALLDAAEPPERFMVGEVFGDLETLRRYVGESNDGLHLVFLFKTLRLSFDAKGVRHAIRDIERVFDEPRAPTWVYGNHDRPRLMDRFAGEVSKAKLFATLALTVRAVPFIYYGEEIGMRTVDIPKAQAFDPIAARYGFVPETLKRMLKKHGVLLNRDECRLPMQWDESQNAGFSPAGAKPWLAPHPESAASNVEAQRGDPSSLLHCYRSLLRLRRSQAALQTGSLSLYEETRFPKEVVVYRRKDAGSDRPAVHVLLHFGDRPVPVKLPRDETSRPRRLWSTHETGTVEAPDQRVLAPHEGVILFDPVDLPAEP